MPLVLGLRLASSTSTKYRQEFSVLLDACEAGGLNPWTLSESDFCYVTLFYALSRSVRSVPGFISAVANIYSAAGLKIPRGPLLEGLQAGLNRLFFASDVVVQAHPLDKEEIANLLQSCDYNFFEDVVFACWLLLSFLAALRPQDVEGSCLRWKDVSFSKSGSIDFLIQPGKGSLFHGVFPFSAPYLQGKITNLSAWFKHLSSFYSSRLSANDPVFAWRSSIGSGVATPISRVWFANKLRSKYLKSFGRLPAKLSAYSLRRGAATVYTRAGAAPTDVSRALRHKNYETTVQYVGSLESSARRENFTRLAM